MEINAVNNTGNYIQAAIADVGETNQPQIKLETEDSVQGVNQENESDQKKFSSDEVQKIFREMNKFMRLLNLDIRFVFHEKTNTLIVQMVDSKDNTVLREFLPHELLDTKAKIREYVGILLDKHV